MTELSDKIPAGFHLYEQQRPRPEEALKASSHFLKMLQKRRSIREFSSEPIPDGLLENCIAAAGTAPSGANKQPWHFCVVRDPEMKSRIREAAEKEEYENYHGRMSDEWLEDLKVFGTDWHKPFLQIAPVLVVLMKETYAINTDKSKGKNYYVNESVGIAAGMFLAAIQMAGLAALTHTPSPMNFLSRLLNRPANEKPFLLIPVGYPAKGAKVPLLEKKPMQSIITEY
jgi:nitroreductase